MHVALLMLTILIATSAADPLEQIFRKVLLIAREYSEKVISKVSIPKLDDVQQGQGIAFQLDRPAQSAVLSFKELLNTCPPSMAPPTLSSGSSWQVSHVSKRLLQTLFADVDEAINRLVANQPIASRKPISVVFQSQPTLNCVQLTVLNEMSESPFEFSFYSPRVGRRSIIGSLRRPDRTSLTWNFVADIQLQAVVAYATQDVVVLGQADTVPACDNFLVLQRDGAARPTSSQEILSVLNQLGASTAWNGIVELIPCHEVADTEATTPIIRPASQVNSSQ